ncbi:DUF1707 SHOCT-like domain-containing protein [Nocardioides insulae]|uniref:DUF1707 SHOCT-like domain-containing protein n=1 Tax=Nocardioides insulae TaxID=394734 RepID=UPI000404A4FB|nr:DUF1707 domain-containing protein [Nocardioides insulae]
MSDDFYRIADADRERAAARLSDHFAEGRLDHDEYNERLDAVWSARTAADLRMLFHDLPMAPPTPQPPSRPLGGPPVRGMPGWLVLAVVALGVLLFMVKPWLVFVLALVVFILVKKRRRRMHQQHGRPGSGGGQGWQRG